MKKNVLMLSIVCLMFLVLSYTYSAFKSEITGNLSMNTKDWVFKVGVENGSIINDGYKIHLSGTNGSFNININTVGSAKNADYSIEFVGDSSIKFYTDSNFSNLINNNIYNCSINSNLTGVITIYYKSNSNIDSDILIKTKGKIMETAMMKNGVSASTEFWNSTYKSYIRTIEFDSNIDNKPTSCTGDSDLCWDVSYDSNQDKKVYAYLTDSGLTDSTDTTKTLYDLHVVSTGIILAPQGCGSMFSNQKNLVEINFNDKFDTSSATDMGSMFANASALISIDLSNFDTSKVTNMSSMFANCSSMTQLNLSSFNTSNVADMTGMFIRCSKLLTLDLSNFDTSHVYSFVGYNPRYSGMFANCSSLTTLKLTNFNTSNITDMSQMFFGCKSLISLDLSSFDTSNVTSMSNMFSNCSSLTSLNLSSFNTSRLINVIEMFSYCSSLPTLDLSSFDTSNVTNMGNMFDNCSSITILDLTNFDTSNVTGMSNMFRECAKLQVKINVMNGSPVSSYFLGMFYNALSDENAYAIIGYLAKTQSLAEYIKNNATYPSKITIKQI